MHKVIFDTDPGVDDAMALLFLHRHPAIELLGITHGLRNASIETTTRNRCSSKGHGILPHRCQGHGETFDAGRAACRMADGIHAMTGSAISACRRRWTCRSTPSAHRFIIDTVGAPIPARYARCRGG